MTVGELKKILDKCNETSDIFFCTEYLDEYIGELVYPEYDIKEIHSTEDEVIIYF